MNRCIHLIKPGFPQKETPLVGGVGPGILSQVLFWTTKIQQKCNIDTTK